MRIAIRFAARMMLTMHGDPLCGNHTCSQPQPESEEMRNHWMQIEAAMRLMAMQKNRYSSNRDVSQAKRYSDTLPECQRNQTVCHKIPVLPRAAMTAAIRPLLYT